VKRTRWLSGEVEEHRDGEAERQVEEKKEEVKQSKRKSKNKEEAGKIYKEGKNPL